MTASDELFQYLDFLENESKQSRILGSVAKASGLFCLATGTITLATLPGWGVFVLAGGVVYGGMCLREARKTGRMMPIPFAEVGIDSIVRGIAKAPDSGDSDDLLDYHYLIDRQKSDYALLSICAAELGHALDQLTDEKQQRALWAQVSRRFHTAYRSHIKENPDFLSAYADKSELLRFVLASADEMRAIQKEAAAIASQYQESSQSNIGANTKLNAIEATVTPVSFDPTDLLGLPLSLLWGSQGSGKTTLAMYLAYTALERGYTVAVADPDYRLGDWQGLTVVGKGGNYFECDGFLQAIMQFCDRRYEERASKGTEPENFKPYLFVLEEFTNWSSECSSSSAFIKKAVQKFRKVNLHVLLISHGNTLATTGNAKGYADTFKNGSVQLELKAQKTPVGNKILLRPTGYAELVECGVESGLVTVPDLSNWKPPTDVTNPELDIDHSPEISQLEDHQGDFRTAPSQAKDVFAIAKNKVNLNSDDILDLVTTSKESVLRLINYLSDNKRGQLVTVDDVIGNKANRNAGLGKVAEVQKAFELMELLGICQQSESFGSYLIVD